MSALPSRGDIPRLVGLNDSIGSKRHPPHRDDQRASGWRGIKLRFEERERERDYDGAVFGDEGIGAEIIIEGCGSRSAECG